MFIFVSIKMLDGGGLKENKRDEDEYQEDGLVENATHDSVSTLRWNYSILSENSTEAFSDMFSFQTF